MDKTQLYKVSMAVYAELIQLDPKNLLIFDIS